jgi:hypothetical protein
MNQGFNSELLDGQRKLLSLFASGSPTSQKTGALQPSNGPVANLAEVGDILNFPPSTIIDMMMMTVDYLCYRILPPVW